jgi:mannose-1-phosphate guanylyltransferase
LIAVNVEILAAGVGTRLYPITPYVPKALLPIGNRYVIEHIIEYLKPYGISEIVMLVSNSEFELVQIHLGDGTRYGMRIEYSVGSKPSGEVQ